jgi:hypothetical protein
MVKYPNLKSQQDQNAETSNKKAVQQFALQNASVAQYLLCFIDDFSHHLPRHVYSCAAQAKDRKTVESRFSTEGLSFATKALPKLSEGLFLFLETGKVNYPSFKLKGDTGHPAFLSGLFRLAYGRGEYQVEAVRLIYQFSVCFKKLVGPYPDSVLSKQYADFVSVDSGLADIDWFSDVNFPILEQARKEINSVFKDVDLMSLAVPRPGPGATNTPVAKHMRYRPHVLYTQVNDVIDYVDMFQVNPYDVVHQTKLWRNLHNNKVAEPHSRYKSVFKTFGKGRGICIEENEVQFFQQAFRRALYKIIDDCPITNGKINFSDQSINALLALLGSWTGQQATLDLSEASDRNARELISWMFQDTTFHDILMALSTRIIDFPVESGVKSIRSFKFAPMGSSLCFPIMSLVNWALCRSIISFSSAHCTTKEEVYVYGDDIVVPSCTVEAILTYLPRFGMKVNQNKSFYRSGFRESCGVHAFNGVNITPVYIKYIPVTSSISQLVSCTEVESQLAARYPSTARRMRADVTRHTGALPFVPYGTGIFGFKRADLTFPVTVGSVRKKVDAWGNPTFKFRVVRSIGASKVPPPTEVECYLRKVLTNPSEREIGGKPDEFYTRWCYVQLSQMSGSKPNQKWWEENFPGLPQSHQTDARSMRDINEELRYDRIPSYIKRCSEVISSRKVLNKDPYIGASFRPYGSIDTYAGRICV